MYTNMCLILWESLWLVSPMYICIVCLGENSVRLFKFCLFVCSQILYIFISLFKKNFYHPFLTMVGIFIYNSES